MLPIYPSCISKESQRGLQKPFKLTLPITSFPPPSFFAFVVRRLISYLSPFYSVTDRRRVTGPAASLVPSHSEWWVSRACLELSAPYGRLHLTDCWGTHSDGALKDLKKKNLEPLNLNLLFLKVCFLNLNPLQRLTQAFLTLIHYVTSAEYKLAHSWYSQSGRDHFRCTVQRLACGTRAQPDAAPLGLTWICN